MGLLVGSFSGESFRIHKIKGRVSLIFQRGMFSEKGIAAIEFALFIPLLVVLLMGIIDFGMLMTNQAGLVNASREGARSGIILSSPPKTATDIENVVKTAMANSGWETAAVNAATVTVTGEGGITGTDLSVQVDSDYTFMILSYLTPLGHTLPLSASTTMKNE